MGGSTSHLLRNAITDLGFNGNKIGGRTVFLGGFNSLGNRLDIITVLNRQGLETEGLHTLFHIFRKSNVRIALNGNLVGIIQDGQFIQLQGSGKGKSLGGNSLHQTTVSTESIGSVVYQL